MGGGAVLHLLVLAAQVVAELGGRVLEGAGEVLAEVAGEEEALLDREHAGLEVVGGLPAAEVELALAIDLAEQDQAAVAEGGLDVGGGVALLGALVVLAADGDGEGGGRGGVEQRRVEAVVVADQVHPQLGAGAVGEVVVVVGEEGAADVAGEAAAAAGEEGAVEELAALVERAAELERGAVALLEGVEHVEGGVDQQALVDRAHELEREAAGAAVDVEVVAALDGDLEHGEDHARGLLGAEGQQEEAVLDVGDLAEDAQLDRGELDVGLLVLDVVGALGPGDDREAEVGGGLTVDDAGVEATAEVLAVGLAVVVVVVAVGAHVLAALAVDVLRPCRAGPRGRRGGRCRRCQRRGRPSWRRRGLGPTSPCRRSCRRSRSRRSRRRRRGRCRASRGSAPR